MSLFKKLMSHPVTKNLAVLCFEAFLEFADDGDRF